MYYFDYKELRKIAELSKTETFALWYDKKTNKFYFNNEAPDSASYIYDVEQEESPEFIADITQTIMKDIDAGLY